MSQTTTAFHGSDLEKIEEIYGIKKEDIVNFAANVNPLGFSKKAADALAKDMSVISRYPDPAYVSLKTAISSYTKANVSNIILGNGVTELLTIFFDLLMPKHAVIVGPTYSEYEKDLKKLGCKITHVNAKEENNFVLSYEDMTSFLDLGFVDLVILCNPNNPTSGALRKDTLDKLAKAYSEYGVNFLIDETYVEFSYKSDDISAASLTNTYDNVFVLRGTSKFFATPGLRLGYALTSNERILAAIASKQDPWNINSVAEFVGSIMFTDEEYIQTVRKTMEAEKHYFIDTFATMEGFTTYPVNGNIILVKLPEQGPDSAKLFDILISKGLMIRNCSTFESLGNRFIRICFMSHEDNVRLMEVIKAQYQ